jgi:HEAT repeat protein
VGLLADALLDPATDFAIRRRLPRVLAHVGSARAVNGLVQSLEDDRFEVRYQSARALDRLLRHHPDLRAGRESILAAVGRELVLPEPVWRGQRLIDGADPDDEAGPGALAAGDTVEGRSVEHVFTLLGTILPRDAVQAARRGLETDDAHLRALAIEYLEGALPPGISAALRARLSGR